MFLVVWTLSNLSQIEVTCIMPTTTTASPSLLTSLKIFIKHLVYCNNKRQKDLEARQTAMRPSQPRQAQVENDHLQTDVSIRNIRTVNHALIARP